MALLIVFQMEYKVFVCVVCALIAYIAIRRIVKSRRRKIKRNASSDVPK